MAKRRARPVQLELRLERPKWGGARKGAGRKARPERRGFVPHVTRPGHRASHGAHITMRLREGLPSMRSQVLFRLVRECLVRATKHKARVIQFSVQSNHLHLIVEGTDETEIARGMQGLASVIARRLNRQIERRGQFWRDRYHRRDLTSPRQARRALVYVLQNNRKHGAKSAELDPCSSAAWFFGWKGEAEAALERVRGSPQVTELEEPRRRYPVRRARTWLLAEGWKRGGGLIGAQERPRPLD